MYPHCLLFVHLGHHCWTLIGCWLSPLVVLVVVRVGGWRGGQHIPGNTFQSAAAAAAGVGRQ